MTITFVSNYINHHQLPFCDACYEKLGADFTFLQCIPMEEERVKMGWNNDGENRLYVRYLYKDEKLLNLIMECDILLAGWSGVAEVEAAIIKRLNNRKPTFRISERIYKSGQWKVLSPRGMYHRFREYTRYRKHPYYLLCAGAYVASDFHLIKSFPDKKYRWGYFPLTKLHGDELWQEKKPDKVVKICWAGRFINWKHPDYIIRLARDLKRLGYSFHIDMVGSGGLEDELKKTCQEFNVIDEVTFHGAKSPEYVRHIMEKNHIFILTSDYLEGWGAVLNEAMNSGLAVVASAQAGASCYLIENEKNGFLYFRNSYREMRNKVRLLLDKPAVIEKLGHNAYETIAGLWNAEKAVIELLRVCQAILDGDVIEPAQSGPFSVAPITKP